MILFQVLTVVNVLMVFISFSFCSENNMFNLETTVENLKTHVTELTLKIGERSVAKSWNIEKTARYIEGYYENIGLNVTRENYIYRKLEISNIVAEIIGNSGQSKIFLLGAHYDSVAGTVGADDNASSVAVQLEVARLLAAHRKIGNLNCTVKFVSFPLEEPPVFGTWAMGSRIYARKAKKAKEQIDGMICLEMVGYTCSTPGCQSYPFPVMFFNYPKTGNFIGIIGNFRSRKFSSSLYNSFKSNTDLPVEHLTVPMSGYFIPNIRLSDHASFWDTGYKAVMITDTAFYRNPHYHRKTDTMARLDFTFMGQLVKSLATYFLNRSDQDCETF